MLDVRITEAMLTVTLPDQRIIAASLSGFPRLMQASERERNNWRIIGNDEGIHWEDLDEDISLAGLMAGKVSGESQSSFNHWLAQR